MSSHFRFDTQGPIGRTGERGPPGPPGPRYLDCSNIVDVSGIYFCNGTSITTFSGECITISGCLDMSCNSIVDVSQIDFCECDIVLTKPQNGGIAIGFWSEQVIYQQVPSLFLLVTLLEMGHYVLSQ